MGVGGRRSKLTPELQKHIVSLVAEGNYFSTACAACGIGETTFYGWMERGRNAKSGKFVEFVKAIKRAEGQAEATRLRRIAKAGDKGNWTADAWYLERKNPEKWGNKGKIEHSGKIELEIEIDYG